MLQGIFQTQGSNPGLPHCKWILYRLSQQGSPRYPLPYLFLMFNCLSGSGLCCSTQDLHCGMWALFFFLLPSTTPPPNLKFKVLWIRSVQVPAKCIFLAFAKRVLAMPRSHQPAVSGCGPGRQIPILDAFCVAKRFLPCPHFISTQEGLSGTWTWAFAVPSHPRFLRAARDPSPQSSWGLDSLCSGHWPAIPPCALDANILPSPTQGIPCPCVLPMMPLMCFLLLLSPAGWHLPLSPQPLCLQGFLPESSPNTDQEPPLEATGPSQLSPQELWFVCDVGILRSSLGSSGTWPVSS